MPVTVAPSAQMVLDQLSPADRETVERALRGLALDTGADATPTTPGGAQKASGDLRVLAAPPDLRILFERRREGPHVVDVATDAQLAYFRRTA